MFAIKKLQKGRQRMAENEVIFLQKVKSEYVLRLFDYNLLAEPFILLELAECSLQEVLRGSRPNEKETKRYAGQILKAVDFCHERNVCHNDLKADNILLVKGQIKLGDFGIASEIDCQGKSLLQFNLCCHIASPEKLEAFKRITGRSTHKSASMSASYSAREADIWSLGILFYKMVTDRSPYLLNSELDIIWCPEFRKRSLAVSPKFDKMLSLIFNSPIAKMEQLMRSEWLNCH